LRANGTVTAWGQNDEGVTDVPAGLSNVVAVAAKEMSSLALRDNGTVAAWGQNDYGQTNVPAGLSNVVEVTTGGYHSLALRTDGTVAAWGLSNYGQTNVPGGLTNVVAVAAGGVHSLALRANGTVVAWGNNQFGQGTVSSSLSNVVAIAAGWIHSLALRADGTVVVWGDNQQGQTLVPPGLSNAVAVAAGNYHNLAVVDAVPIPPQIVSQPRSRTNFLGSIATFSVRASGTAPLAYRWRFNGTNLANGENYSGVTTANLTLTSVQSNYMGNYAVVVTNAYGSVTSVVASLIVNPPAVQLLTNVARYSAGGRAVANSEFSGNGYFPASNAIDGSLGNYWAAVQGVYPWTLTVTFATNYPIARLNLIEDTWDPAFATSGSIEYNDAGVWRSITNFSKGSPGLDLTLSSPITCQQVKFTGTAASVPGGWYNRVPCVVEFEAYAVLTSDKPLMTTQPTNQIVAVGAAPTFSVFAIGVTPMFYQWRFNGTNLANGGAISGATTADLTISGAQTNHTGSYSVVVTNSHGSVTSGVAVLTVLSPVPAITSQPANRTNVAGTTATFAVSASGASPLAYQWRKNGTNLANGGNVSGALTNMLTLSTVTTNDAADYTVVVTNSYGGVTSQVGRLLVLAQPTLADALDTLGLVWTFGGSAAWFPQAATTHDGLDAAQSGLITHSQESWIQTSLTGPGTLSYWWKVSSESNYDHLEFYLDGVLQSGRISGSVAWQQQTFTIAAGTHTAKWRYMKDVSINSGQDEGWVDQVIFIPDAPLAPVITQQPSDRTNTTGTTTTFTVAADGMAPMAYQWRQNGFTLTNNVKISGVTTPNLTITSLQTSDAGNYTVVVSNAYGSATSAVAVLSVPVSLDPIFLSQWPGWPAGPFAGVAVSGNHAFVASGGGGMQVIDVNDPFNPVRVGGYVSSGFAKAVALAGNYAYVAVSGAGLQVIDVSNPANPVRVGGLATSYARDVAVAGNYAYVADHDAGLQVIDVSIPSSPVRVGGYDTSGFAEGVAVAGRYAYLADSDAGLQVIDVSNPTNPVRVGGYDTSGYAKGVALAGSYAYVADYSAGLQVIDVRNPTNLVRVGGYDTSGYAMGVALGGNFAYVADYDGGVQVIEVSDPTNPVRVGGYDTSGYAMGVALAGSYAYVADYGGGLQVIDVSNPTNPVRIGNQETSGTALSVELHGDYAYVADFDLGLQVIDISNRLHPVRVAFDGDRINAGSAQIVGNLIYVTYINGGLRIFDISAPTNLVYLGGYSTYWNSFSVQVSGGVAFMADGNDGLQMINVTTPSSPVRLGGYDTSGHASGVALAGNYAYVADGSAGLQVIDVRNPTNLVRVGGYDTSGYANGVALAGSYAYVADGSAGLQVIDVRNPTNLVRVGGYDTSGYAYGVALRGTFAYIADYGGGVQVIDVSNPANLVRVGGCSTIGYARGLALAGNYAYVAASEGGLVVLQIASPVNEAPQIVQQPVSLTNMPGTAATFTVTATGSAPLAYQWRFNGTNMANGGSIAGVGTSNLTVTGVQMNHAGNYSVVVTNTYGVAKSSVAVLTVLPTVPAITSQPVSRTNFVGTTATFTVTATGTAPLAYQWRLNGTNLVNGGNVSGVATTNLTLASVKSADAGGYSVVINDAYGSVTSAIAMLTVWLPPQLQITRSGPQVLLSWPTSGPTFVVETSSNLSAVTAWRVVISGVTITGNRFWVTNQPISNPAFYRLRQQTNSPAPASMVLIPAGPFVMGNCMDPSEGYPNELPLHTNQLSAFYMDKYPVTKALWDEIYLWAITNGYRFDNAGIAKATNHPVLQVYWYDCVKWCNARSEKAGLVPTYYTNAAQAAVYRTGQVDVQNDWVKWTSGYRLPTEAEWEKAARGGTIGQRFPWGNTISWTNANYWAHPSGYAYDVNPTLGYHPNFYTGDYPYTNPVDYFTPNGYGLHDMEGNVGQWCWDWDGSYSSASQSDPRGANTGSARVHRGGSWGTAALGCRSAFREHFAPSSWYSPIGFRLVLAPGQP
jgi:formylglycine-generating enzyme required for sulfatase activity